MNNVMIVPFEGEHDAIFLGIKEFPSEKIILISPASRYAEANKFKEDAAKLRIIVQIIELQTETIDEFFKVFNELIEIERGRIVINLGSSEHFLKLFAQSAAFIHGIKAFDVIDDRVQMLPIMKTSYYEILSDKKMKILQELSKSGKISSLGELGKRTKMGPSLINYHIYGSKEVAGLKRLGVVEVFREKGKIAARLTSLGKLLMSGKSSA
jgi:DNA-binding transcriptional ArsR family regulator